MELAIDRKKCDENKKLYKKRVLSVDETGALIDTQQFVYYEHPKGTFWLIGRKDPTEFSVMGLTSYEKAVQWGKFKKFSDKDEPFFEISYLSDGDGDWINLIVESQRNIDTPEWRCWIEKKYKTIYDNCIDVHKQFDGTFKIKQPDFDWLNGEEETEVKEENETEVKEENETEMKEGIPLFFLDDSKVKLVFELEALAQQPYKRRWLSLIYDIIPRECVERNMILQCCINHCKLHSNLKLNVYNCVEGGVINCEEEQNMRKDIRFTDSIRKDIRFNRTRINMESGNSMEHEHISMFFNMDREAMRKWTLEELVDIRDGFALGFGESIGEKSSVIGNLSFWKYPECEECEEDERLELLIKQQKKLSYNHRKEFEVYKKLAEKYGEELKDDSIPEFNRIYEKGGENAKIDFEELWNSTDIPEHSDEEEKIEIGIDKRIKELYTEKEEIHRNIFKNYFSKEKDDECV
jgi:hypothetical protein